MRNNDVKRSVRNFCKGAVVALSAAAVLTVAPLAQAELVTNGSFEDTTNGNGQLGYNTNATGWTTSGYNFLYASGTADNVGANGSEGNVALWGPGNGSNNGLPASSPDGGNFVAMDSNYGVGALTQTLTGLTAGDDYLVSFYWAAAQQYIFTGGTSSQLTVGFGSSTQSTPSLAIASEGFSGWQSETFDFVADGASDVLSFLASSDTPGAEPPFALLDGVSVEQAPEPGTWVLMLTGILGAVGVSRSRQWMKR